MKRECIMKRVILIIGLLLIPFFLLGQWQAKELTARRTTEPINMDGQLNEDIWKSAQSATDFIQFSPNRGEKASEDTIVKIVYDDDYIYFGFMCYDKEPEKIVARMAKRDTDVRSDDSVYIMVDTHFDRRTCYGYATNLLGTQFDARISDNGRTTDTSWDGIWLSAGQRTAYGYSMEVALDLSNLKYEPGENKSWGLSLGRGIPRKLEHDFWVGPIESAYKVSQFGILKGLNLKKAGKKTQVIPHVITELEEGKETRFSGGVDVRYAFSQQVSGNLTINPDFATIEADQEQINLTRFELNLREKRNFFLEGADMYSQRIRLFYSRRISDIYGGAKVYGKAGGYEFAGMSAQTKNNNTTGDESANFSVFRLKKDIMKSSNIGLLLANKMVNGRNQGTAGFDTALYFSDTFKFTGQFAVSYGDYNSDNIAFFLRPSYDTATFHIHLRYTQLGRNFMENANAVGFIRDDNRREFDSAVSKTFYLSENLIERIEYESNYNIYWGLDGTLRSWKIDESLDFDLKNKFSFEVGHHQEFKLYEKEFRNYKTDLELGYNTREWQSAQIEYSFGHNYDLDFKLIEGSLHYKVMRSLSLEYAATRLFLDPDPDGESTWIHVIRASNYFTKDLFVKLFYQLNSSIEKKNIQLLFVYRFQPPFGSLQLAYQKGTARFGERGDQGHTLFIKFAYMF